MRPSGSQAAPRGRCAAAEQRGGTAWGIAWLSSWRFLVTRSTGAAARHLSTKPATENRLQPLARSRFLMVQQAPDNWRVILEDLTMADQDNLESLSDEFWY